jgi:hypothetical protein
MDLTVIIPVKGEIDLELRIDRLRSLLPSAQVIVVDSSIKPLTPRSTFDYIHAPHLPTRAEAMNVGAAHAQSEYLWFLHSDCIPTESTVRCLPELLKNGTQVMAFLKEYEPNSRLLRLQSGLLNWFSRRLKWLLVGTNGLLMRKDAFFSKQGFPAVPLFEDVLMFDKVRHETAILPHFISVSSRKYSGRRLQRVISNLLIYSAFRLGAHPERLARLYR